MPALRPGHWIAVAFAAAAGAARGPSMMTNSTTSSHAATFELQLRRRSSGSSTWWAALYEVSSEGMGIVPLVETRIVSHVRWP